MGRCGFPGYIARCSVYRPPREIQPTNAAAIRELIRVLLFFRIGLPGMDRLLSSTSARLGFPNTALRLFLAARRHCGPRQKPHAARNASSRRDGGVARLAQIPRKRRRTSEEEPTRPGREGGYGRARGGNWSLLGWKWDAECAEGLQRCSANAAGR